MRFLYLTTKVLSPPPPRLPCLSRHFMPLRLQQLLSNPHIASNRPRYKRPSAPLPAFRDMLCHSTLQQTLCNPHISLSDSRPRLKATLIGGWGLACDSGGWVVGNSGCGGQEVGAAAATSFSTTLDWSSKMIRMEEMSTTPL